MAARTDPNSAILKRFVASIQRQRGDIGSRTLTVRQDDLRSLALMYDMTVEAVSERLVRWQVLAPESVILDAEP